MSRGNLTLIGFFILALLAVHINGQDNCTAASNTYWTGYRCACKVGYKNESNVCVPLTLLKTKGWVVREPTILPNSTDDNSTTTPIQTPNLNPNCYLPYEYFNGAGCVCLQGYSRINGLCQYSGSSNNGTNGNNTNSTNVTCPANSALTSGKCVCNKGYTMVNNLCIVSTSSCGANSYDNGLGFCVCNTGYYKLNNTCVAGSPCPPSSTRNSNGTCVCDAGLTKYGDYCAKCPLGAIFDTTSQKCVYVCGQNAAYDTTQQKCLCLSGYGIVAGVCTTCASGYFIQNNYCVTCPVNSAYNSVGKRCDCSNGYLLNKAGFCVSKCSSNEVFNSVTGNCDCVSGLGRINGVCSICPNNTVPSTNGSCGSCPVNQRLVDGNCICAVTYIPNQVGVCTPCTSVSGAFLINGQCATCPGDLTYDGSKCSCAAGKTRVGTSCRATCNDDELVDENGLCYKCPIYEVIADGKCSCKVNYVRNSTTSQCQLTCPSGQFSYQGRCAQCPLNLKYRSEIGGCACPDGQYLNTNGVCQQVVLTPITCDSGFYFDKTSGCIACTSGCKTCSSATVCITCTQTGFSVVNGVCKAVCGDGVIAGTESCDDKNNINGDGCSSTCAV